MGWRTVWLPDVTVYTSAVQADCNLGQMRSCILKQEGFRPEFSPSLKRIRQ